VKKSPWKDVVVVSETKLIPDTDLRSPSTIERHKGPYGHLSLIRVVNRLGYHIIVEQSFLFFKLRDINHLEFFCVRHFTRVNEKMKCEQLTEEVERDLVQKKFGVRMAKVWKEYLYL
jgi:hypothetical protein